MDGVKQPVTEGRNKKKIPGIILMLLGIVVLSVGIFMLFVGRNADVLEEEEPIDVYFAEETNQYSYALVEYMTESIAYFEAMESMQFYIVFDRDWNPAVVCLDTDELVQYQPYIDWLYSESYENGPEETTILGYAQPFDEELKEWIAEGYNYIYGEEIVNTDNFADYFGNYYLQTGQGSGAYKISNTGIYLLLLAVILFVAGGVFLYEKPAPVLESYENSPVIMESSRGLGILGALCGALIGGLAWSVVGALGYVSGWIGILIIFFAYKGYSILSHKEDKFGLVISILLGILVIIPATYLYYGWSYYCAVNESVAGYVTLPKALAELPVYLSTFGEWGSLAGDMAMGYLFMLVAAFYMWLSTRKRKNKTAAPLDK